MPNIRINGKVNLKASFEQEERSAMINQKFHAQLDIKQAKSDPYETIKIIQKNLISDFDEIIAERNIYALLLNERIQSPLYHIEKLSELVGKAKAIKKSKVYKLERRIALQKAIDIFTIVKDRLSAGILDDLKNVAQKKQVSETNTASDGSSILEKNYSAQEIFSRNIHDSLNINRQRLGNQVPAALSEPSESSGSDSDEEMDDDGNLWSKNRLSSTSSKSSFYQPTQMNFGCTKNPMMSRASACISPPLRRVTPHFPDFSKSFDCSASPFINPPLPSATPLYNEWNEPQMTQIPPKKPEEEPTMCDDLFNGHFPTQNIHLEEIDEATLENLRNLGNFDGKLSDSNKSGHSTKHYFYDDGELTEFAQPKKNKPNQSIDSTETSNNSSKSENSFLELTQKNLAKFEKINKPIKKFAAQKVSGDFLDELDEKLKLISKKVEATKRKIDDVIGSKKQDDRNPKKPKTEKKQVRFKLVREKKLYEKESPEIKKIIKKYNV